MNFRSKR